jgi:hypothetical protein
MVEKQLIKPKNDGFTLRCFVLFLRVYFPIQNLLKIFPSKSSVVISPVMRPK